MKDKLLNFTNFKYKICEYCLICGKKKFDIKGIRGNREYFGANKYTEPHVVTNIVQCKNCSFIFCNPAIENLDHLEENHYNDPEVYNTYLNNNYFPVYINGINMILRYKKSGLLLDVGAGKGEFLSIANSYGFKTIGIEPSPLFCNYAFNTFKVDIINGYLGDKNSLQINQFDILTLFHVLEHIKNPKNILSDIHSYLKDDGIVYIEVPNADSLLLRFVDIYYKIIGKNYSSRLSPMHAPFHSLGYTTKSIRHLLESNDFIVIEIKTFSSISRGYNTKNRIKYLFHLIRGCFVLLLNIFPNRELISLIAKKK